MLGRAAGMVGIGVALLLGCGGPAASGPAPDDPTIAGPGTRGAPVSGDPEQQLRALVEDVVGLAEKAECSEFGASLTRWTDSHSNDVESLIASLSKSEGDDVLAELDAYVETRRLAVLEAAANCGDFDDAWPAWQHFEAMVDEARE